MKILNPKMLLIIALVGIAMLEGCITTDTHTSRVGTYYHGDNYIRLHLDNTYDVMQNGMYFSGTYYYHNHTILLRIPSNVVDYPLSLTNNTLIDHDGDKWTKQ